MLSLHSLYSTDNVSAQILTGLSWPCRVRCPQMEDLANCPSHTNVFSLDLACEYEQAHERELPSFFDGSAPKVQHPEVQEWAKELTNQRDARLTQ